MKSAFAISTLLCAVAATARATPVQSITFDNGTQALNIEGVVESGGSLISASNIPAGSNYAFFDLDFSQYPTPTSPGPAYAWEYVWSGTNQISETTMIQDIAAATKATVSPLTVTSTSNPAGYYNFDYKAGVGAPYYENPVTGVTNYWGSFIGQYDSSAQSVNWEYAPTGTDDTPLGYYNYTEDADYDVTYVDPSQNGLLYGWVNLVYDPNNPGFDSSTTPNVAVTPVPEPSALLLLGVASCGLLKRGRRSR